MPIKKHEVWLGVSDRMLEKETREYGWNVFRYVYWAVFATSFCYLSVFYASSSAALSSETAYGMALLGLAVVVVLYSIFEARHQGAVRDRS